MLRTGRCVGIGCCSRGFGQDGWVGDDGVDDMGAS